LKPVTDQALSCIVPCAAGPFVVGLLAVRPPGNPRSDFQAAPRVACGPAPAKGHASHTRGAHARRTSRVKEHRGLRNIMTKETETFMSSSHSIWKNLSNSIPAFLVLSAVLLAGPARAATVTSTADDGSGSLREAIANAV